MCMSCLLFVFCLSPLFFYSFFVFFPSFPAFFWINWVFLRFLFCFYSWLISDSCVGCVCVLGGSVCSRVSVVTLFGHIWFPDPAYFLWGGWGDGTPEIGSPVYLFMPITCINHSVLFFLDYVVSFFFFFFLKKTLPLKLAHSYFEYPPPSFFFFKDFIVKLESKKFAFYSFSSLPFLSLFIESCDISQS